MNVTEQMIHCLRNWIELIVKLVNCKAMDFQQYDDMHPEIWEAFKEISFQTRAKGFIVYSAKGIFEIIRWHRRIKGGEDFKVNNNYAPDYARKMEKYYPDFDNFFRKRMLKKLR